MPDSNGQLPGKLARIAEEFAEVEPRERLELLLEFAEALPPLPPRLQAEREASDHRVQECMTPVYLWVELENGRVQIHGDVAPESPTVKGFVGILAEALSGATAEEVVKVPQDLVQRLGLMEALGMVRMRGLFAIVNRVRTEAVKLAATQANG